MSSGLFFCRPGNAVTDILEDHRGNSDCRTYVVYSFQFFFFY